MARHRWPIAHDVQARLRPSAFKARGERCPDEAFEIQQNRRTDGPVGPLSAEKRRLSNPHRRLCKGPSAAGRAPHSFGGPSRVVLTHRVTINVRVSAFRAGNDVPFWRFEALAEGGCRQIRNILHEHLGSGGSAFVSPPVACKAMFPVEFLCAIQSLSFPLHIVSGNPAILAGCAHRADAGAAADAAVADERRYRRGPTAHWSHGLLTGGTVRRCGR